MTPDFTLTQSHGFHLLSPNSDSARALVAEIVALKSPHIGADYEGKNILLEQFFAFAGDWCRLHVLPRGLSLQWGNKIYKGDAGIAALWKECA